MGGRKVSEEMRGPFGAFLYKQLSNGHFGRKSAKWLADQVKIKSSRSGKTVDLSDATIRHWLRGARAPQIGHPAIPWIAEVFGVSTKEIEDLQSLSARNEEPGPEDLLAAIGQGTPAKAQLKINDRRVGLKEKSLALCSAKSLMETAISILESLPDAPPGEDNKVLMTFQGEESALLHVPELEAQWFESIKSALGKGWNITHLIRINHKYERVTKIVSDILQFIGHPGSYIPLAFSQLYVLPVAYSLLLIPSQKEGMISFASKQRKYIDSAIYIRDAAQIQILENHFNRLENDAKPFLIIYEAYQQAEFLEKIIQADKLGGDRIVVLKRLSEITRPLDWYVLESRWTKELGGFLGLDSEQLSEHIQIRRTRMEILLKSLESYTCRSIYTGGCVQRFADTGLGSGFHNYFKAEPLEIIQQLETIRDFLIRYENYQLALTEEELIFGSDPLEAIRITEIRPSFCEVLDDNLVIMEIASKDNGGRTVCRWVAIEEPIIVRAFHEYLLTQWESIDLHNSRRKDRYIILRWLDKKISYWKNKMRTNNVLRNSI